MDDSKRDARVEAKIDKIGDRLSSIDITLAEQHISLREHMRRTALLEAEVMPIKRHVDMVSGAIKFIMIIAAISGIIVSLRVLLK